MTSRTNRRRAPEQRSADRQRQRLESRLQAAERNLVRGRFDTRTRQVLDSVAQHSHDLTLLNRIGDLLARAGRIGSGIALFERVGRAYAEDGFWAKAIAIYKKILRYDPGRADIRAQLAALYLRSGRPIEV